MTQESTRRKPATGVRRDIEENLKRVYQDALQEQVPDRFKDLLAQLKAKDQAKTEGGA